jgi:hypothetical protein
MAKAKTPRTTTTRTKKNGEAAVPPAVAPEVTSASESLVAAVRSEAPAPAVSAPSAVTSSGAAAAPARETRKAAPEARRNIVPINLEEEIRARAYQLYQERGCQPGHENEDWLIAEREIRSRYDVHRQHTA